MANSKNMEHNRFEYDVDLRVYSIEAANAASYKFTDGYYIEKHTDNGDKNILHVTFMPITPATEEDNILMLFCNELIDQQLRVDINRKFGHIRDLIVEEAFKPVSK